MIFNIINITNHKLPETINQAMYGSHLDYPKPNDTAHANAETLLAGWLLVRPNNDISFEVIIDGESQPLNLTKDRPDVIKALVGEYSAETSCACGFELQKSFQKKIAIFIKKDANKFLWKSIEKLDFETSKKIRNIQTYWDKFVSGDFNISSLSDYQNNFIDTNLKIICKSELTVTSSINNIPKSKLDGFNIEKLQSLIKKINNRGFGNSLLIDAQKNNKIKVCNIFRYSDATCQKNILLGNINYLVFISSDEVFFIAQHKFAADAVYFPKRRLLIRSDYGAVLSDEIEKLDSYLLQQSDFELASFKSEKLNFFKGIIIAHGRPYHYFYDHLLGVSLAHDMGLLEKVNHIFSFPGSDFYDPAKLFDLNVSVDTLSPKEINENGIINRNFSIFLGCDFRKVESSDIRKLDNALIERSIKLLPSFYSENIYNLRKCFPVIWIGVSSQKRNWIEQETAIPEIINRLYKIFPNLGIVFDGWTSPVTPLKSDEQESNSDQKVVERIIRKIPNHINKVSIVGKQSSIKIAFANSCDFFITNYSTGSIHIARICQKPGVGHLNKTMNRDEHIHFHTYEIPKNLISDVPDPLNPRCDFTSYSISAESVYDQVKKLLSEVPVNLMRKF